MFSFIVKMLVAVITTLVIVSNASSQQVQTPSQTVQDNKYVTEKGFRSRVFELKHRDPNSLFGVLEPLGSGFKGATISVNREFKTLTARDFPENIAVMEEAIKRLDVPEPSRPGIEFRIHVLVASNTASVGSEFPTELNDVIKQLQSTLKYKNYGLMTSSFHRTKEGRDGINNKGVADSKLFSASATPGNPVFYNYLLAVVSLDTTASQPSTIQVGRFNFEMKVPIKTGSGPTPQIQYESVGFNTPVSMREGEKVVVGTTTIEDKALVVVLSANVVK